MHSHDEAPISINVGNFY